MPTFLYQATAPGGGKHQGQLEAPDRPAALRALAKKGLQPQRVEAGTAPPKAAATTRAPAEAAVAEKTKLKRSEVLRFTEELADLLAAGIQLEPALKTMGGNRPSTAAYPKVVTKVADGVREGLGFSASLKAASPSFGELYCNLAEAGEAGGSLGAIIDRQALHLKALDELRGKFISALLYPAFLVAAGIFLLALFVWFLVPKLERLLVTTGGELSWGARMVVGASHLLASWWWLIGIFAILLAIAAKMAFMREEVRLWWDRVSLRLPGLGKVFQCHYHVHLLETLSNLVGNGLPLLRALQLASGATANRHVRGHLKDITDAVAEGGSLSHAMDRSGVFQRPVIDRVRIGEQSGRLKPALARAAERADRELSTQVTRIGELVQPAIIFLMACLVGAISYLMIGVIYDTITGLQ